MLTRRQALSGVLAGGIGGLHAPALFAQSTPTPITPVSFSVPPGACDCHVHVFPDPATFPFWEGRVYTPPVATVADLLAHQASLGLERAVIVQPSVYGTDNSAALDTIRQLGPTRARGVAVIGPDTSAADLDAMQRAGICGIRLNLATAGVADPGAAKHILDGAAKQIADRPWHVQVYTASSVIAGLKTELAGLPMPVVFDHFAGADGRRGADQPGFDTVLALLESGKAYVKLSAPYRTAAEGPDYPGIAPLARALVAANPDRIIWASDWPHPGGPVPPNHKVTDLRPAYLTDDGRTLGLLAQWFPDAATRRKILVDNPMQLYGF